MKALPKFTIPPRPMVESYITRVLTHPHGAAYLRDLIAYDDGHFRALFDPGYFVLPEGQTEPSKSQWNTLKKRMKRINPQVFIFKETGFAACDDPTPCAYVDFGFFAEHS